MRRITKKFHLNFKISVKIVLPFQRFESGTLPSCAAPITTEVKCSHTKTRYVKSLKIQLLQIVAQYSSHFDDSLIHNDGDFKEGSTHMAMPCTWQTICSPRAGACTKSAVPWVPVTLYTLPLCRHTLNRTEIKDGLSQYLGMSYSRTLVRFYYSY